MVFSDPVAIYHCHSAERDRQPHHRRANCPEGHRRDQLHGTLSIKTGALLSAELPHFRARPWLPAWRGGCSELKFTDVWDPESRAVHTAGEQASVQVRPAPATPEALRCKKTEVLAAMSHPRVGMRECAGLRPTTGRPQPFWLHLSGVDRHAAPKN